MRKILSCRNLWWIVLCAFLFTMHARAQHACVVACWNVENLFDTRHDTLKNDTDFTPDGAYRWTKTRYWRKLDDVARTIAAIGGEDGLPVLMGLCEVENDSVLHDLTCRSAMRSVGYGYVMTESADARGVDVALLYLPYQFRLLDWHAVRVPSKEQNFSPTRDVLYAKGVLITGDTLHAIVCHLPSKAGGGQKANKHRRLAAATVRGVADSVLTTCPDAKLLVMGDFNATSREAVFKGLMPPLYETLPTSAKELMKPIGTYYYQRQWSYLDHILVSDGFRRWQPEARARECRLPFLLTDEGTPKRTFRGPSYNGGVSDHLPLSLVLRF